MNTALPSEIDAKIALLRDALQVLKPAQCRLLSIVLGLARPYGYCWAQQRTLATCVGSAKSTVADDLRTFYALGLVRILKAEVARAYGDYEKAKGRSDVIVPAFGLDQAMADLRAAEEARSRAARAEKSRIGRPRVVRKKPPRGSARSAGAFGGGTTPRPPRSRAASKSGPTIPVASDKNVDFRPKAPTGPEPTSRTQSVPISKSRALAALPTSDAVRKDAEALISEGLDRKAAIQLAKIFVGRPGLIARNIALGEHRTKANPPGWLTTAIRGDYASARISVGSEADAVRRAERPVRAMPSRPQNAEIPSRTPLTAAPKPPPIATKKPEPEIQISPETQARLSARAWEEIRKTHAYLGTFSQTHPVIRGAMSRTIRRLYESESAFGSKATEQPSWSPPY